MENKRFTCEICLEAIVNYQPHVRIGADQVIQDHSGSFSSLMKNNVMVFATYHTECLQQVRPADCEEVVYIEEARELLSVLDNEPEHDTRIVSTRSGYLA